MNDDSIAAITYLLCKKNTINYFEERYIRAVDIYQPFDFFEGFLPKLKPLLAVAFFYKKKGSLKKLPIFCFNFPILRE